DDLSRLTNFAERCDHRQHHAQLTTACSFQQRTDLGAKEARTIKCQTNGAPAKCWIFFMPCTLEIGQHLVATNIDGAEGDWLVADRLEYIPVQTLLRLGPREG